MRRRDLLKVGAVSAAAIALRRPTDAFESFLPQQNQIGGQIAAQGASQTPDSNPIAPVTSPASRIPVIDSHIHLFDPTRTGGVPWPEANDTVLYKPAIPSRYEALARPFGVVGAIAIEASPLASDNQWLLDIAAHHPLIVGIIGDLVPATPQYLSDLDRLHRDPLFLGFRYGNLWGRDLAADLRKHGFLDGLKSLAQAGLVFETANPDPSLIRVTLNIAERVPDLRIVIDHLPNSKVPPEPATQKEYWNNLRALAQSPHVYTKLSEIPVILNGKPVTDFHYYEKSLDELWNVFSEDHILFGSDWPNSDHIMPYAENFKLVQEYVSQKTSAALEKFYWKNSVAAYQWKPRRPNQPRT